MWVYLGDVTDEKESTLKFLEKVKIVSLQNARRQAQSLTVEKYLCRDSQIARLECILIKCNILKP